MILSLSVLLLCSLYSLDSGYGGRAYEIALFG